MRGAMMVGAIAAAAGCGRLSFDDRPHAVSDAAFDAPEVRDAPVQGDAGCAFGAWAPPVHQVALSSPGSTDWGPSMSADGLTLVFASNRGGTAYNLLISDRTTLAAAWPAPTMVKVGPTGTVQGGDPQISGDGLTLMWTGDQAISLATRASRGAAWGAATTLLGNGTLYTNAAAPSLSPDGTALYFTATARANGNENMFVTTRVSTDDAFPDAIAIPGVDESVQPQYGSVGAGGTELVYETGGTYAVFLASRAGSNADSPFGAAAVPPELGGSTSDIDPDLSVDGHTLWFASMRDTGDYDLYETTRPCM